LHGKVKLYETSKSELLDLWKQVLGKNEISIQENSKVESIIQENGHFKVETLKGEQFTGRHVLLAIGRRGSPRKLGIPGETLEKVAYRLLEPELITGKNIVVVGGGDSAIESALLLADQNKVILSYRSDAFSRIKPKNSEKIVSAAANGLIDLRFNTNLVAIDKDDVTISSSVPDGETHKIKNDLVFIFAGGELPTQFLMKAGLQITKKFGEAVLKHKY
jgi:thioredoxin reductase (NADPH)